MSGGKKAAHCVYVDCPEDWPYENRLKEVIAAALDAEGVEVPCVVDVCITDDAGIQETNRDMRGVDAPTDVLSFPMFELAPGDKPRGSWADPGDDKVWLGDMMISAQRAAAQAEEYGHGLERELAYLAVHSVLHLLGYDHLDEGPEKARMREREEAILAELGLER